MKKEVLKIGIAIFLLFAIAIPLSLYRQKTFDKIDEDERNKKFITIDLSKVQRIQITNKHGDVVLDRRKKDANGKFEDEFEARSFEYKDAPQWIVTKPFRGLADPNLLEGFMIQIKDMVYQKVVQETQDRKKDYDLDPALLSLRFFTEDTSEPKLVLNMGGENPGETAYYFSASDKPGIYLGERLLQPYKEQSLDRWLEKRVLGIPNAGQVESIRIQHSDKMNQAFDITRDNTDWILGPVKERLAADTKAVNEYAANIDNIRAIDILSDPSLIKNAKTIGSVTLKFKSLKDPVTYYIFKNPKQSDLAYLQRSDMKSIFSVGLDPKFLPSFDEMVSKKLISKAMDDFTTIKIIRPGNTVEIANENQVWKIKKPYQDDANPRRLDAILKSIFDLKTKAYLPQKILNQNDLRLGIEYTSNDKQSAAGSVSFFQEGREFFVRADGSTKSRVFSISQIPPDIREHLAHLRNDDLVPVANEHVKRLIFTKGNARVEIEQNEKKQQWFLKFLEGVPSTVNMRWKEELAAEELFDRASEMYIVDFVDDPDPKATYETATLNIFSDQNKQYTWKFGEKKGELISVYSPDRNIVGTMPWVKYQELSTFLDEPKKTDKK